VQLVNGGKIVGDESLETVRERHLRARPELPLEALKMFRGGPVIETVFPGTGDRNPYRTQPSGLRAAGGAGKAIAGLTREL